MSTTRLSSGKSEVGPGSVVEVARFTGQFMVGRELEPMSSISDGQRIRDYVVSLTYFNDVFMSVKMVSQQRSYTQLIPWASVATVILK